MSDTPVRLPHYQHLYETLRQQLLKGVYAPGNLLPSEKELQQAYTLTQPTVRQALSMLADEGYIKKYQGKGSVVQPLPIGSGMLSIEPQFPSKVLFDGKIQTEILKKPTVGNFPESFLFVPDNPSGLFYYLERIRLVNNEVIFYEKIAIPAHEVPDFHKQKLENRSLFGVLRTRYNVIVKGGEEKVWATAATPPLTDIMKIGPGTPVLRLEKRIETNRPHLTFYSSLYARTDTYLLQGRF